MIEKENNVFTKYEQILIYLFFFSSNAYTVLLSCLQNWKEKEKDKANDSCFDIRNGPVKRKVYTHIETYFSFLRVA